MRLSRRAVRTCRPGLRVPPAALILALAVPLPAWAQERGSAPAADDALAAAVEALQTGEYRQAVAGFRDLARSGREFPASARGWARALAATGEYESALEALDRAAGRAPDGADPETELARARGVLLRGLGRLDEAEANFRRAIESRAGDAQLARLDLGRLRFEQGAREEALALFDGFIDFYNRADPRRLDAEHLRAVAAAVTYLGVRDPDLFHDAVRAYEEAIEVDPGDPEARIDLGLLFLDKYDSFEAGPLIDEALARNPVHPRALLAKARRAKFDGSSEALELAEQSLETNPDFTEARVFLARLYLELEDVETAEEEARRALETNPVSLAAWTEIAAAARLRGDAAAFAEARDRIFGLDPRHADLYVALAQVAYRTHRYGDAVEFARQAVSLDPLSWAGRAELGLNQLRVGEIDEGRATLEATFEGDPFNVWVFNTLDLLEELAGFETATSPRFSFSFHPREAGALSIYATALAEEAFDAMRARYGYAPPTPISVEVYDRHADFSVRTVGLAGIGALGVSFGSVLAMDSPSARPGSDFNWGSTLWHEISHAFTLGYTEHRLPRWLSEGLAVLDERHAREGWGSDPDPGFLAAFAEERLPSLERFNYGFVRPAYPGQVQHAYYMASLLCEMLETSRGFEAILAMLDGYRDGLETTEVVERALGTTLADLDRELKDYIETRFGRTLAALGGAAPGEPHARTPGPEPGPEPEPEPESFAGQMIAAAEAHRDGRSEAAIEALSRARDMFPEYAGPDAPTLLLGRIHREAGNAARAAEAYRAYTALNENHLDAHLELADVEEELGNEAAAREALERAIWIDPFHLDIHTRLAAGYEAAERWTEAARERRALLALAPADLAEAHYRLALALHRGGDAAGARRAVLDALEIAPNFEVALDLLLEIRGDPGGTR
ncbi:tetratricopeptide repeat protein [Candidatus Palauibacter sp.]|uniref:tetratricopeptide repeat protein n=1 Tax=Candidatus Palauibacter sp. TaxID=3101350 RepID=UPI003B0251FE